MWLVCVVLHSKDLYNRNWVLTASIIETLGGGVTKGGGGRQTNSSRTAWNKSPDKKQLKNTRRIYIKIKDITNCFTRRISATYTVALGLQELFSGLHGKRGVSDLSWNGDSAGKGKFWFSFCISACLGQCGRPAATPGLKNRTLSPLLSILEWPWNWIKKNCLLAGPGWFLKAANSISSSILAPGRCS